ncbi:MAG: cryptochrome/photolyase family protein [Halothiobacillus sp.]|jgi:deoxyribodipyrimidine photolyase-related protein|nr:cryptochrome/photolyase family protein [Halothiobacillus sp.]
MRQLIVVLGDQLNRNSAVFDVFDPDQDAVFMAETTGEAAHVWSHKHRIALFFSAMRHFAATLRSEGITVHYAQIGSHSHGELADALAAAIVAHRPQQVIWVSAGAERLNHALKATCDRHTVRWSIYPDRHFIATENQFSDWAKGRKSLRLEYWYRQLRQQTGLLMEDDQPIGGIWNFDAQNRATFDARGPGLLPSPLGFPADAITQQVIETVERHFPEHPGALDGFDWPVTPEQAEAALADFITHRLPLFGHYQDAMWTDEPWLYHSRLSAALNLKLIDPATVCRAAEAAYHQGQVPLAAAEGFIRQILGWREYVRGLYANYGDQWLDMNALDARHDLPDFFWTGDTSAHCLSQTIGQTLRTGYAHHIQRLMVTGLYCLLAGVRPRAVHEWYLAVYVDAVEWVEIPNVIGMSQFADGGIMASKPYIASGSYIDRMSNYCANCPFNPKEAVGAKACPFTTLYWAFLDRHEKRFARHPRLALQVKNLQRKSAEERALIRAQAARHLADVTHKPQI